MEMRRIQITGGASYMITLPKEWADSAGLKKNEMLGTEVQSDGTLLLIPNGIQKEEHSAKVINADSINGETLYRRLVGAYISGHGSLEVRASVLNNEIYNSTLSFTQATIGMEVIEEDDEHILIKDLMDHAEIRPSKNIERMGMIVHRMISDVFEFMTSRNIALLEGMESKDQEIDRIYWLISRQSSIYQKTPALCKRTGLELYKLTKHQLVGRIIERIGDHIVLVSDDLLALSRYNRSETADKGLKEIGKGIMELFSVTLSGWMKQDRDAAEGSIEKSKELIGRIKKAFEVKEFDHDIENAMNLFAGSSRRIAEYCIDISELTINASMD